MKREPGLIQAGVLTVGIDASPPPPFHCGLPGDGFEVDLLAGVAQRLGISIMYRSSPWSEILHQLIKRELDIICTAATITAERKRIVEFSRPYFTFELVLVVSNRSTDVPRDLAGKAVGVRVATTAEEFVRQHTRPLAIRTFELNVDAYRALQAGELDAVVDDEPIARSFERAYEGLKVGGAYDGTRAQYGIVLAKGNRALKQAIDAALEEVERDGSYERIYRRWFGENIAAHALERR